MLRCCFMCRFKSVADLVDGMTCFFFFHLHKHFRFLSFAVSAHSIIILFQIFIWTGTAQCVITVKFICCKRILSVHPSRKTQACSINVQHKSQDKICNAAGLLTVLGLCIATLIVYELITVNNPTLLPLCPWRGGQRTDDTTGHPDCLSEEHNGNTTAWNTYLWRIKVVCNLQIITFTDILVAFSFK